MSCSAGPRSRLQGPLLISLPAVLAEVIGERARTFRQQAPCWGPRGSAVSFVAALRSEG